MTFDSKMLEVLKPDIFLPEGREADPRLGEITIRHLLQHTAGWDRDKSGDPMFQSRKIARALGIASPPAPADVIREVLGRPLDDPPGTRYVYSNFGYCLLGRIIEKLSGQPYERLVQERVLRPAGITGPKLGATLRQAEGEARYYMPVEGPDDKTERPVFPGLPDNVPGPYGAWWLCLESMDAHGGWIMRCGHGSLCHEPRCQRTSPFRRKETYETISATARGGPGHNDKGDALPASYGCGFFVKRGPGGVSLSHGGSLPGTVTYLWKRTDGGCWAVFFNQRIDSGPRDGAIVAPINKRLDAPEITAG